MVLKEITVDNSFMWHTIQNMFVLCKEVNKLIEINKKKLRSHQIGMIFFVVFKNKSVWKTFPIIPFH